MNYTKQFLASFGFIIIGLLVIGKIEATPLDDYVFKADPTFGWTVIRTYEQPDYTLYILNFTSQKWLDGNLYFKNHFFNK